MLTPTASDRVEAFLTHHHRYNGVGTKRINAMRRALLSLSESAGVEPEEVSAAQLEEWMSTRLRGLMPSSVHVEANMAMVFFKWCWRQEIITSEQLMRLQDVPKPSVPRRVPRPYDKRELLRFERELVATYPNATPLVWKRWRNGTSRWRRVWRACMQIQIRAEVALALDCGLRQFEIRDIAIDDIHPDNDFIVVREGKGGKYREVPQTDATREDVHRWLELRRELNPPHDRPWMILDPRASDKRYATWIDAPGERSFATRLGKIGGGWELHRFRHTCGTEWLRAGMDIELVQRLLGHSDIAMTLTYTELVGSDIHRSAERVADRFTRAVRPGRQQATGN